ncbi:hypothetical protein [Collinsella ihumii]|uniref:DUF5666 domain-containing protein n=1 Tax=Collinsella ihumii TaxID=1720204 RepID=A0ABT7XFH4_9ACTN|nr:hypothetical protein [Collinsella ihumii]MDN0064164.1 hypothetical protein [Collinsella ihumii]
MGRKNRGGRRHGPTRARHTARLTGTVRITDAGAFVETAEGAFRLTQRGEREAMNGDVVTVSLHHAPGGNHRAVVEGTLSRANACVVGTYELAGPWASFGRSTPASARISSCFRTTRPPPTTASCRAMSCRRAS